MTGVYLELARNLLVMMPKKDVHKEVSHWRKSFIKHLREVLGNLLATGSAGHHALQEPCPGEPQRVAEPGIAS